jgi:hypothetical protein
VKKAFGKNSNENETIVGVDDAQESKDSKYD